METMPWHGARRRRLANVSLAERAYRIRRNALRMGEVQGQGYIAQALGIADVLAVAYFHALSYRPGGSRMGGARPLPALDRPLRDRALRRADRGRHHPGGRARDLRQRRQPPADVGHGRLHAGHGDHRRLARPSAWHRGRHGPGAEAQAVRRASSTTCSPTASSTRARPGRRRCRPSHWKLDNLIAIVDVNNQQADGRSTEVLSFEPLAPKWEAFGWHVQRVDGNDIDGAGRGVRRGPQPRPSRSRASSSATPRWPRACRSSRRARRTTSSASSRTNGSRRSSARCREAA